MKGEHLTDLGTDQGQKDRLSLFYPYLHIGARARIEEYIQNRLNLSHLSQSTLHPRPIQGDNR